MTCHSVHLLVPTVLSLVLPAAAFAQDAKAPASLPPAAEKEIDFARDIEPILTAKCLKCHGEKKPKSNYRLDGREAAIKGGEIGGAIVPGKSAESNLIKFVAGLDKDIKMPPPPADPLTPAEVGILRAWVDQGLKWPEKAAPVVVVRTDVAGLKESKTWVTSVAFSPDGSRLASGGGHTLILKPGEVKVWDLSSGKALATLEGHASTVWSVAFDKEGKRLASASYDKQAKVWDLEASKEIATLKGHANWITSVVFSPDGALIATGSEDATAKLWKAATGEEAATLKGHGATVRCVAFSPDGSKLATGSFDKTVKIWDAAKGAEIETLSGHADAVWSVAFSRDGKSLATGSADGTVKIWALGADGKFAERTAIKAHGNWVASVAFSPDGRRLATSGFDRSVKLWDVASGLEVDAVDGLSAMAWSVAFSPDGSKLAVGLAASPEEEETVRIWTLPSGRPF
jgi:WD40 repeat protein